MITGERTVLIVDDHPSFRASARLVLSSEGFDVVGEAADGAEAVAAARELKPAFVLLDVQLPDTDGFAVAAQMGELDDPPKVFLTSSRDASDFGSMVEESCAGGCACGFIPKSMISADAIKELLP